MSVRPPSELRVVADRLAQAFNSPSGAQAIALLQLLGMGSRQHVRMETASEGTSAPPDILGIWQRQAENGAVVFRRSPRLKHRWRHWADLESFMQHTSRKRVLFVGESVARGHFYDPYYTPSLVLESLLRTTPQLADVEVLDLASCGILFEDLFGTLRAAAASSLAVDAVVIFAGECAGRFQSDSGRRLKSTTRPDPQS